MEGNHNGDWLEKEYPKKSKIKKKIPFMLMIGQIVFNRNLDDPCNEIPRYLFTIKTCDFCLRSRVSDESLLRCSNCQASKMLFISLCQWVIHIVKGPVEMPNWNSSFLYVWLGYWVGRYLIYMCIILIRLYFCHFIVGWVMIDNGNYFYIKVCW